MMHFGNGDKLNWAGARRWAAEMVTVKTAED